MAKRGAKKVNKKEVRTIAVLAAIFSVRMLGLCMLLPVFAIEAMHYKGASAELIGMAVGSYGLAQAGCQIPCGWLSDRYGRKPLIIAGLGLIVLGSLIGGLATSINGLIIGRVIQGCGAIGSVVLATLTESVSEQTRGRAMAILGATIGASFAVAIVLGPTLNAWLGLSGLFIVIGVMAALCAFLTIFIPANPTVKANRSVRLTDLFTLQLTEANVGVFVLHATLAALFLILPHTLQEAGIAANKVWYLYLFSIVIAMLVAWRLIASSERRENLVKLHSIAIFCLLLAEVLLYTVNGWIYIAGSMALFFSAFCVLEASLPALVAKHATAGSRGTAMGLYACLQFLGVFVGGAIGGWLHGNISTLAVMIFCVLLSVSWLILNVLTQKTQSVSMGLPALARGK